MKSSHKVIRYDYSKIEKLSDFRDWYEYYGIHPKSGRLHIDTKRLKKVAKVLDGTNFLNEAMFKNRETPYLIPNKIHKYDYIYNIVRDMFYVLKEDWYIEYKPALKKIKTPSEVENEEILANIAGISDANSVEDAYFNAQMSKIKRIPKYEKVIKSLYAQFISKVRVEVDRIFLNILVENGYSQDDYRWDNLMTFCDTKYGVKNAKIFEKITNFDSYDSLSLIDNFIKHNTIKAYKKLQRKYPTLVFEGNSTIQYKMGMYAVDWLNIPENYIEDLLNKLELFLKEFCRIILSEDVENANWNYDDYFKMLYKKLKHSINF